MSLNDLVGRQLLDPGGSSHWFEIIDVTEDTITLNTYEGPITVAADSWDGSSVSTPTDWQDDPTVPDDQDPNWWGPPMPTRPGEPDAYFHYELTIN